jgi:hypothetical protein
LLDINFEVSWKECFAKRDCVEVVFEGSLREDHLSFREADRWAAYFIGI